MVRLRPHRYPGKLIVAEGIDTRGTATQLKLLQRWLQSSGISCSIPECPVQIERPADATATTQSLLRAAEFVEKSETNVIPLLRAGAVVLASGYAYSLAAEDAARGFSRKWTRNLYGAAIAPNLRFYFRLPLDVALQVIPPEPDIAFAHLSPSASESLRLYRGRVVEELDSMADSMDFHVIDATLPIEAQQKELREVTIRELKGRERTAKEPNAPSA